MRKGRRGREDGLGWLLSLLLGVGLAALMIWTSARSWNGAEVTFTITLRLPGAVERVETGGT